MVEEKFLGVHQGPEDVLESLLGFVHLLAVFVHGLAIQVTHRHIDLLLAGQSRECPVVEAVEFHFMTALLVGRQFCRSAIFPSQLFVDVLRVKQVKTLGKAGLL